mgnify:CR=1 FL=1
MHENEIATTVLDSCFKIHRELGPGLFESVYEEILFFELEKKRLEVKRQTAIPVIWGEIKMDLGFRADLIINNKIILEIKSIEKIAPVHKKQVLTYLRLMNIHLGLLINFNEAQLKDGITRVVNNL